MTYLRSISVAALLWLSPASVLADDATTQTPAQTAQDQPSGAPATPLAAQSLDRLSATRERPLFSPTRRPPPPPPPVVSATAPPPPPSPPPNVALYGIVMDGDEARALVRTGPTDKLVRVRIGDDVGGWMVSQIEGRRLVLSLDGRHATFTMFSGNSVGAAPNTGQASSMENKQQPTSTQQNQAQPPDSKKHRRARQ